MPFPSIPTRRQYIGLATDVKSALYSAPVGNADNHEKEQR
jgi:hypothetical protein